MNDEKLLFVDFTIWYVHTMVNTGTLKKILTEING